MKDNANANESGESESRETVETGCSINIYQLQNPLILPQSSQRVHLHPILKSLAWQDSEQQIKKIQFLLNLVMPSTFNRF